MSNEPFQWIQHPPRDLSGGFYVDMQMATTQIGGVLLVVWAGVWHLVSLDSSDPRKEGPAATG